MQSTKWTLQGIGTALAIHVSGDIDRDKKISDMYKILVTGNGVPALPETVRKHNDWIEGQKEAEKNKKSVRAEYQKSLILLIIGQIITIIGASAAILLGLKR